MAESKNPDERITKLSKQAREDIKGMASSQEEQEYWAFIETAKYEPGIAEDDVANLVEDIRQSSINFAIKHLKQGKLRDNYKEFLKLVIVFLGTAPARGVQFMLPRAIYHACWMSKVFYSFKIWMFKAQIKLTIADKRGLRDS